MGKSTHSVVKGASSVTNQRTFLTPNSVNLSLLESFEVPPRTWIESWKSFVQVLLGRTTMCWKGTAIRLQRLWCGNFVTSLFLAMLIGWQASEAISRAFYLRRLRALLLLMPQVLKVPHTQHLRERRTNSQPVLSAVEGISWAVSLIS
jgi:hypothetical protein